MSNFELIDDFLANRLTGKDREAFESQLSHDPSLKSELDLQRQIVEGIKQARAAELKAMLSKVPVTGGGAQIEFTVMRIAAGLLLAGIVSAAAYYYFRPGEFPPIGNAAADVSKTDKAEPKPDNSDNNLAPSPTQSDADDKKDEPAKREESSKAAATPEQSVPAQKPSLDVTDPSAELENEEAPRDERPVLQGKPEIKPSQIKVEMDSSNKKYDFHYQFAGSKLMLYGSFNRSLYEVLEINGSDHSLFLFYKNNFYLLDENQEKI